LNPTGERSGLRKHIAVTESVSMEIIRHLGSEIKRGSGFWNRIVLVRFNCVTHIIVSANWITM